MTKAEENWKNNYLQLKKYVAKHHQLPAKSNFDQKALLNWWKYNMKKVKRGEMPKEKLILLSELSKMREISKVDLIKKAKEAKKISGKNKIEPGKRKV